jgi:hypothetical protein
VGEFQAAGPQNALSQPGEQPVAGHFPGIKPLTRHKRIFWHIFNFF